VITRSFLKRGGNLSIRTDEVQSASVELERDGFTHVPAVFTADEVADLRAEMHRLFAEVEPDVRLPGCSIEEYRDFRYEALNHNAAAQRAVADPRILAVIEPLLGEDCHVVSNTCWWNQPQREKAPFDVGNPWHIDGGPHIPRPEGIPWDDRIPYPVFMIGCHILLEDCPLQSGPTGFSPRSHTSGRTPPMPDADGNVSFDGRPPVVPIGEAGDLVMFVSDVWHRRMPTGPNDTGRLFLQVQYGRRDIAQRLRTTDRVHHLSPEAVARAVTPRERTVVGLHPPGFFDG
jgi:ectoine hydroxylase-related dioxygenase (phytanoyl-CoA dioxygenase family)